MTASGGAFPAPPDVSPGTDGMDREGSDPGTGRPVRIGLAGVGLVGRRHVEAIDACDGAELVAVADPSSDAPRVASAAGAIHHVDLPAMLREPLDAVILATPNHLHRAGALECVAAGVPFLVEKPLAASVADAREIVEAAERAGVPALCGHHRRHDTRLRAAYATIARGQLGRLVTVQAATWLPKPADYFDTAWRRGPEGGPLRINMIHDVDLLRWLVGEVAEVQAIEAHGRGDVAEDAAVALLRFVSGALGTLSVTDNVPAPLSWEMTAGENPAYPNVPGTYAWIGGTGGAIELPSGAVWHSPEGSWMAPITRTAPALGTGGDPFVRQIADLVSVVRAGTEPLVSARDGLAAVEIVEAVKRSAATGRPVRPGAD